MKIEDWQFNLTTNSDNVQKVNHVYWFVKNNLAMSAYSFREVLATIRDLCTTQSVEWVIMMMAHGTYVYTDKPLVIDPVMLKLADGINFEGEVIDAQGIINQMNTHLEQDNKK